MFKYLKSLILRLLKGKGEKALAIKFKNNATSTLAGGIAIDATTVTLATGQGDRFPIVADPDYFYATLADESGNIEIVKCTARADASDDLTIVRAQDGSTARAWLLDDKFELRLTAGVIASFDHVMKMYQRATFTYNGAVTPYTIKAAYGSYYCKEKYCYWNSELTTTAISTTAEDTAFYLYLDHSAITSGTEITASELIWSTTAPAWDTDFNGWYNGDDRCIFVCVTNSVFGDISDDIREFNCVDDCIIYNEDYYINLFTGTSPAAYQDVDCSVPVPPVSTKILVSGNMKTTASYGLIVSAYWRVNGMPAHGAAKLFAGVYYQGSENAVNFCNVLVFTDSSQIFEIDPGRVTESVWISVAGFYLPKGM